MIDKIISKKGTEITEDKIITFNRGIPGFEDLTKFILEEIEGNEVFCLLKSIEDEKFALVVISPFIVDAGYSVDLNDNIVDLLRISNENQVLILNTVTLNSDMKKITSNLAAPIIINIDEKIGEQIILNNEKYQIKTPIFKE